MLLLLLLCAVYNALGARLPVRSVNLVKETYTIPPQWSRVGPAPSNHIINLQIGLKQSQIDELERHLYEVNLELKLTQRITFPKSQLQAILVMEDIYQQPKSMN